MPEQVNEYHRKRMNALKHRIISRRRQSRRQIRSTLVFTAAIVGLLMPVGENKFAEVKNSVDKDFLKLGPQPSYTGRNLTEIAFPLGGIGTGSISLGGWGQLRDWEIKNRPAKGFVSPRSFFTLKIRRSEKPPIIKVIQGPVQGSFVGGGHSVVPSFATNDLGHGLPHFRNVKFTGHYPVATVHFDDPDVPLDVTLQAFNPFIPLNAKDSGIPVAVLTYTFKNKTEKKISATVFGNLTNITGERGADKRLNQIKKENGMTGLYMTTETPERPTRHHGSMVLAAVHPETSVWLRWPKDFQMAQFWKAVALRDDFPPPAVGESDTGTIAVEFTVDPRGETTVNFLVAWYFPIFEQYWKPTTEDQHRAGFRLKKKEEEADPSWKTYYASLWSDAWDVACYTASNLDRLQGETHLFRDALFESTLPAIVLDAVSSQISTLKTNTCLRLEDGTFYGFEGCSDLSFCCDGSCSHVWYYAQALPYLFPKLQRSMLNAHFSNSFWDEGFMTFRMALPLGKKYEPTFFPAADGQMGLVLQVYRDWLLSGNDEWLKSVWPKAKKALEFAWQYWDTDKDGVMEGLKHNTYNIQFYGPETLTGSLYLAILLAAAEISSYLGDEDSAAEYLKIVENENGWTDKNLFNGEYYEQKVIPSAHEIWPKDLQRVADQHGRDDRFLDWPKWQFGKGCLSDQLIGQWYAEMLGLGKLYDTNNIRNTLQSIFKYNWKPELWDHPGILRVYALNDESGLLICTWPKGERPGDAFFFADEIWCGIEYQVASHMIYEGMLEEGLAIVKGVRDRHRGDRRNPWDEFECGHHYVRSMASYALLLSLSGYRYSAPQKSMGFTPRIYQEDFKSFFSTATGWGVFKQKLDRAGAEFELDLRYGSLELEELDVPAVGSGKLEVTATFDGHRIVCNIERTKAGTRLSFDPVPMKKGHKLSFSVHPSDEESHKPGGQK